MKETPYASQQIAVIILFQHYNSFIEKNIYISTQWKVLIQSTQGYCLCIVLLWTIGVKWHNTSLYAALVWVVVVANFDKL